MPKTQFEVTDITDDRVLEILHEDDVNMEEYVELGGDFWIDCDYLVRPDGTVVDFVCVVGSDKMPQDVDFAVVHDIEELDDADQAILIRFLQSLTRGGMYNALRTELVDMGFTTPFPAQNTWTRRNSLKRESLREGKYLIAFRGGVGYCYGFYDMGESK